MYNPELIWVLDSDEECVRYYRQTLGLQYELVAFSCVDEVLTALRAGQTPSLLICDPMNCKGSFDHAYSQPVSISGEVSWRMPECLIVSNCEELEVIRFYFKAGVRDFVSKPIRSGELIAKVERVMQQISNREVLILPNTFDGIQLRDLTFREHQILTVFLSRPHRKVGREDLYKAIWSSVSVGRKTLDVHLFNLRRKLRAHGYDVFCKDQCFTLIKIYKSEESVNDSPEDCSDQDLESHADRRLI